MSFAEFLVQNSIMIYLFVSYSSVMFMLGAWNGLELEVKKVALLVVLSFIPVAGPIVCMSTIHKIAEKKKKDSYAYNEDGVYISVGNTENATIEVKVRPD